MKQIITEWKKYLFEEKNKPSVKWIKPDFEREWEEEIEFQSNEKQVPEDVRNYLKKHFPNKEAWLKGVESGKAVEIPVKFNKKLV